MKKRALKLSLNRETLRLLDDVKLSVAGGDNNTTVIISDTASSTPIDTCGHACTFQTKNEN